MTRIGWRTLCSSLFTLGPMLLVGGADAAAQDVIPPEFHGDWVPATATCESPARFRVTGTEMTLINGEDSQTYGDLAISHGFFGPEYAGISVVAIPEFNGSQPFTVYFNADEQKDVTRLGIYYEMQGPSNPQLDAIQNAAKDLADRFPLNLIDLKKCPAGATPA